MTESEPGKKRRFGCWWIGGFVLLAPVFLAGIAALAFVVRERASRAELNTKLDEIRAQGLPVDNQSMAEYHRQLSSLEDTEEWIALIEELTSEEFEQSLAGVPTMDGRVTADVPLDAQVAWAEEGIAEEFLSKWQSSYDELVRLSARQLEGEVGPIRFPLEFDSINTLLENTQHMRQAARLAQLHGFSAIRDRNSFRTRQSIETCFGCARALEGEPLLVSGLVRIAMKSMGMHLLQAALKYDALRSFDLRQILDKIREGNSIGPQWQQAVYGERGTMLPVFEGQVVHSEISLPFRSRDALTYLEIIDRVLEVPTADLGEFMKRIDQEETRTQELFAQPGLSMFDSVLTRMITPAFMNVGNAFVREATENRLACLAIAVRLYEMEHGLFPRRLEDLEQLELDPQLNVGLLRPIGGKPFGYLVDDDGALLWGFDSSRHSETPESPILPAEGDMYADIDELWNWRIVFKEKSPDSP